MLLFNSVEIPVFWGESYGFFQIILIDLDVLAQQEAAKSASKMITRLAKKK